MSKQDYIKIITTATKGVGTYKKEFEKIIETLADILVEADNVKAKYIQDGSEPVILFTNKSGATNMVKNPYLMLWSDLNKDALQYWRDLGLTPAGLKKIKEEVVAPKKEETSAADIMQKIRKELNK